MKLWTNDPQVAARQIYPFPRFTLPREEPHHSFGADGSRQVYELTSARLPTGQSRLRRRNDG